MSPNRCLMGFGSVFILSWNLTSPLVPDAEKHLHSMMLPPLCFTMWMVKQVMNLVFTRNCLEFSLKSYNFVSLDQRIFFLLFSFSQSVKISLAIWKTGLSYVIYHYSEWFPSHHFAIKAWMMECYWDSCPFSRYSPRCTGHLKPCWNDWKGPSWPVLPDQGRRTKSRKSPGHSKLLPF